MGKLGKVLFRGRPNLIPPSKIFFGFEEGAKGGGANLTFWFMDGFEWGKGESCLELSPKLKFLERGVT